MGELHAEIKGVRELSPHNWYGEYLRNFAAQPAGRPARGRPPCSSCGALPPRSRPPQAGRDGAGLAATSPPNAPAGPPARPAGRGAEAGLPSRSPTGSVSDPELPRPPSRCGAGRAVAGAAESARTAQLNRWAGAAPRGAWSPRCDIYLYPSAGPFSQMTGQPEDSPGFSTMG